MSSTPSALPVDAFAVMNFRSLRRLTVPKAGRVNLVVGKNNSGKTSLLEAVELYTTLGSARVLNRQLDAREEFQGSAAEPDESRYLSLFHGRPARFENGIECTFESLAAKVWLKCQWFRKGPGYQPSEREPGSVATLLIEAVRGAKDFQTYVIPADSAHPSFAQEPEWESEPWPCVFVSASGMSKDVLGSMWDAIALSDQESDAIRALHLMSPEIERLSFVGERGARRKPMVRVSGSGRRVTLGSFGDGVNRMLALSLALANAKDGVLLVDEIENGIHHSVQQRIWTFLLEAARQLNVQVFATTHSWDCLSAFQQACGRDAGAEGVVIRLERSGDDITATVFDERELNIAARESIEIR